MNANHPDLVVVAADHPSLDGAIAAFGAELRTEPRYFGRRGQLAARPSPSLVARLTLPGCRHRLAGMIDGQVIGVAAVDDDALLGPELLIAVAAPWRRKGLALVLGRAIVARAIERGLPQVVLRTCYQSADVRAAGHELGLEMVDLGRGRVALIRQLDRRSA